MTDKNIQTTIKKIIKNQSEIEDLNIQKSKAQKILDNIKNEISKQQADISNRSRKELSFFDTSAKRSEIDTKRADLEYIKSRINQF